MAMMAAMASGSSRPILSQVLDGFGFRFGNVVVNPGHGDERSHRFRVYSTYPFVTVWLRLQVW